MCCNKIKFSIFCLVVFCLVSLPTSQIVLLGYVPNDSSIYSFYTTDNINTINNATVVKNGNSSIVSCTSLNAKNVKQSLKNILGESVKINNPSKDIIDNLYQYINKNIVYYEVLENTTITYCYNPSLLNFVMIDGQKVNLQIAQNNNYIVIGYPLILGSF